MNIIKFYESQLNELLGGRVTKVVIDQGNSVWPGLMIEMPNKEQRILWFSEDAEGNGPGAYFIDQV